MKTALKITTLLLCIGSTSVSAQSVRVQDGDTFVLGGQQVRLWGIDAPEYDQPCMKGAVSIPCGDISEAVLESFIGSAVPECEKVATDKLGRWVAKCHVGGSDLGSLMVRSGWAMDYNRYSKGAYSSEENAAKSEKRGLWGTKFEWPWDYRHKKY